MVNISFFSMFASLKVFFLFGRVISVIYEGKFYQMIVSRCFLIVFGWCSGMPHNKKSHFEVTLDSKWDNTNKTNNISDFHKQLSFLYSKIHKTDLDYVTRTFLLWIQMYYFISTLQVGRRNSYKKKSIHI